MVGPPDTKATLMPRCFVALPIERCFVLYGFLYGPAICRYPPAGLLG